jgi:acid phosphatase type 7
MRYVIRVLALGAVVPLGVACGGCESESPVVTGVGQPSQPGASTPVVGRNATCLGVLDHPWDYPSGEFEAGPSPDVDCGTPSFAPGTGLRRAPYLQSVSKTRARVVWTTSTGGKGRVQVGPSKDGPWRDVEAVAEFFSEDRTDDADYTQYDARIAGLKPNAGYCYQVVEGEAVIASGLKLNTAWRAADRPVRILTFGDSGNGSTEQKGLRDEFMKREFDLFLHLGDMAYGSGEFVEFEAHVFDIYRDFLHRVPSYPTMGNHEYKTDRGQPYLDVYSVWDMAYKEKEQERYYSFDYGNIHFVTIDSNEGSMLESVVDVNDTESCDMLNWLEDDLAASKADWKIAFFHHPPYTSSTRGPTGMVTANVVPILEAGGVDLVLVGHDHHYERTGRIAGGKLDERGIRYAIVGSGGAGLREIGEVGWWSEKIENKVHVALTLTIDHCEAKAEAIDLHGNIVDSWTMDGCAR